MDSVCSGGDWYRMGKDNAEQPLGFLVSLNTWALVIFRPHLATERQPKACCQPQTTAIGTNSGDCGRTWITGLVRPLYWPFAQDWFLALENYRSHPWLRS